MHHLFYRKLQLEGKINLNKSRQLQILVINLRINIIDEI